MKARLLFHEKRLLLHRKSNDYGIMEIKIWKVERNQHYPDAKKFSLFLVSKQETVIGIDNHKPKGPHLHMGNVEVIYDYQSDEKLLSDFFEFITKAGFEL